MAVILLAVILIGCLLFARGVQQYKLRQYALNMDRQVEFAVPAGKCSLSISSKWPALPARSLNPGMIKGWSIPLPSIKSSAYFYIDLLDHQPEDQSDFFDLIRRYIPLGAVDGNSLQIEKNEAGILSTTNLDLRLLFRSGNQIASLLMKVVFLPDGTSLAFIVVGPEAGEQILIFWIEETARTLKFNPSGEMPKPSPGNLEPKNKTWTSLFKERLNVPSV